MKMKYLLFSFGLLLALGVGSCNDGKKINRDLVDQVNKSNEVKKLGEAEITEHAMEWGNEISMEAQKALMGVLQKAIQENGPENAVGFCNIEALEITKKVADKYNVNIRRVSVKNRNSKNSPNEKEKELLGAYAYNQDNGLENPPNIQKLEDGQVLLYTKAITIPNGLCLNCHGAPGTDIKESTLEKIQSLYPEDKAINYKVGDLRGMWSIALPKKEVIKDI
ncbi:Tll0287-like domain-containing protein [Cyclobacterium qasimii]|nr:DUF3365 domain-containing protein [Cyclobacterium qasimii]EPR69667.1 putative cytochrome c family protein [Cyclobacterium qasimii M12-11B]